MLTYEKARKIGVNACIDKLGRDILSVSSRRLSTRRFEFALFIFCTLLSPVLYFYYFLLVLKFFTTFYWFCQPLTISP